MPFSKKKNYTLCTLILTRILYNKHIFSKSKKKKYLLFIVNNNILVSIINAHGGQDIYNKLKLDHKTNSIQLSQVLKKIGGSLSGLLTSQSSYIEPSYITHFHFNHCSYDP